MPSLRGRKEPETSGGLFVGREETLRAVDEYVAQTERAFRQKAIGTWGMGKSELTLELKRRVDEGKQSAAIRLELGDYRPLGFATSDPSTKTLVQNLDSYCKFLRNLAAAEGSRAFRAMEEGVASAVQRIATHQAINFAPKVEIGDDAAFGDDAHLASLTYVPSAEDPTLDALVLAEKTRLTEQFVRALSAAGQDYGVVILLDDFDKVRGRPVGAWILELVCAPALDRVVVMVTAGPGAADMGDSGRLHRYDLEPFSALEVEEYLRQRFRFAEPELAQQILDFSGGLPHAVTMAADVVAQRVQRGQSPNLDGVTSDEWSSRTSDLLSAIIAEASEEDDRVVLKKGRLARRLDQPVLGTLLFGAPPVKGSPEWGRVVAVHGRLLRYSFVETHDDPDLGPSLGFHDYVRQLDARHAPALQVDEAAVHRALAEHYERQLIAFDKDEAATKTAYGGYYKYEDPGWQKLVQEWTYHAAQLAEPTGHERARIYLACTFLEAFWWWGCYVKFPWSERMLDEWDAAHKGGDRQWSNLLRVILASYPPGYEKDDQPGWPLVEKALVQLRTATGIHAKSARLEEPEGEGGSEELAHRRRLRALTSLFLAHTYKFRSQFRPYARRYFDDALTWLDRCDDGVGMAWTRFEVAELSLALGEDSLPAARKELASAMRQTLDEDEGDYELLANLHRLDGDLHWAAGAVDEAVDGIVRGVVRAYVFQVDPQPPDLYTVTFYAEMLTRLGDRLAALRSREGEERALAACRRALAGTKAIRLRAGPGEPSDDDLRSSLWSGGMPVSLLLAPAPPLLDEVYTPDSSFVTDACMVVGLIAEDLEAEDEALAAS